MLGSQQQKVGLERETGKKWAGRGEEKRGEDKG